MSYPELSLLKRERERERKRHTGTHLKDFITVLLFNCFNRTVDKSAELAKFLLGYPGLY